MASIFKIRRGAGTASPSLTDGELYINYDSSLQYASGATTYTLLPLNKEVAGNIELDGDITASNAYFTNNVRIDGNIILGDGAAGDTIQSLGVFTTNLIPQGNRNVGSTTAVWANVYANNISASTITGSFSGSIAGIDLNAINQFTASVAGTNTFTASIKETNTFTQSVQLRLTSLESYTASVSTSVGLLQTTASYLNTTFSTSVDSRLDYIENTFSTSVDNRLDVVEATASYLNTTFSTSVDSRLDYIENTFSTSVDSRLDVVEATASLYVPFSTSVDSRLDYIENTFSTSVDSRLDVVEATASLYVPFSTSVDSRLDTLETAATSDDGRLDALEAYSASLKTAVSASGQDLIIYGNLTVQGTQTSLNVNEVFVEDKTLTLASGSATAAAADGAGIHIAGANVTMSWDNNNSRINLNKSFYVTGDLSGSTLIGIGNVTTYSTSVNSRLVIVEALSASAAAALNSVSGAFATSQAAQDVLISSLKTNILSASVFTTFSTSVDSRLDVVEATASLYIPFSTSVDARLDSLQTYTASVSTSVGLLQTTASYLNTTFSSSVDSRLIGLVSKTTNLEIFTASANSRLDSLQTYTASVSTSVGLLQATASYLNTTFSNSVDSRLDLVEATASYLNTTFSSSVDARLDSLQTYTASVSTSVGLLETTASYLNGTFSSSVDGRLDLVEATASYLNTTFSSSVYTILYNHEDRLDYIEGVAFGGLNLSEKFIAIESATASLQLVTASLHSFTSSYYTTSASFNGRINSLELFSSSLNNTFATDAELSAVSAAIAIRDAGQDTTFTTFSTSVDIRLDSLESFSASLNTTFATDAELSTVSGAFATTQNSQNTLISSLQTNILSASVFTSFSTSVDGRLDTLELFSSSLNTTFATDAELTALSSAIAVTDSSQNVLIASLQTNILSASVFTSFSTSVDTRLDTLEATTFSSSVNSRLNLVEATASYLNTTFSTSVDSRLDLLEDKDIIINLGGDLSGSAQSTNLGTITLNAYVTENSVTLGTDTSGSYVHTITGTSNQITVAGSGVEKADITLSLPQNIHTSANVQFNSLGVGMTASATTGRIDATNDIVAFSSSDIRFKENIKPIENALNKINQIGGYEFDWNKETQIEHGYEGHDIGVIAQEIEAIAPELVQIRENGYKAVKYDKLVSVLIQAIKELSAKVDSLENK